MRRWSDSSTRPLIQLAAGERARIVYIVPDRPERLVRLSNLGVIPGALVTLRRKHPAAVISIGETTLAVDSEIAGSIYVRPVMGPSAGGAAAGL
jgi:DtxR family Mn-dependent transcriptional regulator